jgi:propanediol utilization protein
MIDRDDIRKIVEQVLAKKGCPVSDTGPRVTAPPSGGGVPPPAANRPRTSLTIPAEASARHAHLTAEALAVLFGPAAGLTKKRALSQPGEFLSEERVRLIGPRGEIANVAVLGPLRGAVQVEISPSDARILGLEAPLRLSGDLSGAADIYIAGPAGVFYAAGSAIIAKNHIHLRPADAEALGLKNGGHARVRINSRRPLVFEDVSIRVRDTFMPAFHIDCDEANACMLAANDCAEILDCFTGGQQQPAADRHPADHPARPVHGGKPGLITEQDARRMAPGCNGKLILPRGSIITPSARDVFQAARCVIEFTRDAPE